MPRRRNLLIQALIVCVAFGFVYAAKALPLPWARRVAGWLAAAAYALVPRLRKHGMENLNLAYGDTLSPAEKERILKTAVRNMLVVAVEFAHMPRLAKDKFAGQVRIHGVEHIDLSRGALCIATHLGNWEWVGAAWVASVGPAEEVVRPFQPALLDRLIDGIRRGAGIPTIPKEDAARAINRAVKDGAMVGILIDQSPRRNGVPVQFFGQRCWATIAPAMIAARGSVPVHPAAMVRAEDGSYDLQMYPALEMVRTGRLRDDLLENTQRCQTAMEEIIRAHPEQWLWFHRRWKDREYLEQEWRSRFPDKADMFPPSTGGN